MTEKMIIERLMSVFPSLFKGSPTVKMEKCWDDPTCRLFLNLLVLKTTGL